MSNKVPEMIFRNRVRGEGVGGRNPWRWVDIPSDEVFSGKNIVVFALSAAITPRASNAHLPDYDAKYEELKSLGVDEVYCMSVTAPFTMSQWAKNIGIENVKMLPDTQGDFTRGIGMLITKGGREMTWRYSAHIVDGEIKKLFAEPGMMNDCPDDPFECSDVDTMIAYLKES
ncbi:redoxin family protein [Porticoccus litoralis]|uniref:Redoxin family protein n=1 Tax=Porticoccus litoralis TaxID=434086 RepID=A0AAW8B423_9GAMM|nr:redoxin family protein [Porticoccus litoralis]MDP1520627.1 redoxin family protein [Porticoccus litoralis]